MAIRTPVQRDYASNGQTNTPNSANVKNGDSYRRSGSSDSSPQMTLEFMAELRACMPSLHWNLLDGFDKGTLLKAHGVRVIDGKVMSKIRVERIKTSPSATANYSIESYGAEPQAYGEGRISGSNLRTALKDLRNFYLSQARKFLALEDELEKSVEPK